jgi:catechol 2,3-dioxygenase-like lactoylglutathione lyase family enzyme
MPQLSIHHLTLSVTDAKQSADWYRLLLGDAIAVEREGSGWKRTRLQWPSGLIIGFTQHDSTDSEDAFDHSRVGLDHIGLACSSEAEVGGWLERMDAASLVHGPMEDVSYGWAVTARDPDGIAVEFFCPKS